MALTSDQITAQNFKDFYGQIRPYLNGSAHGGFTPIGTVISVMGKQAPHNYLVCDGTVYNITDYPELAAYFVGQFNASNFFGGDGVTTFAVPDLRGEFLRGTGTNSHTNQGNGANVGEHQDATEVGTNPYSTSVLHYTIPVDDSGSTALNADSKIQTNKYKEISANTSTWSSLSYGLSTVRPTNTSVLYCIATKNIFMDEGSNYSTDEQVVGTWINGKPIYQKTFKYSSEGGDTSWPSQGVYLTISNNIKDIISCDTAFMWENNWQSAPYYEVENDMDKVFVIVDGTTHNLALFHKIKTVANVDVYATIKYTKTTD